MNGHERAVLRLFPQEMIHHLLWIVEGLLGVVVEEAGAEEMTVVEEAQLGVEVVCLLDCLDSFVELKRSPSDHLYEVDNKDDPSLDYGERF